MEISFDNRSFQSFDWNLAMGVVWRCALVVVSLI